MKHKNINIGIKGFLSWAVIDLNKKIKNYSKIKIPNKIVNTGRNFIGTNFIADSFKWCLAGDGQSQTNSNDINLENEISKTNLLVNNENGHNLEDNNVILYRTFEFPQESQPITYHEIGFSPEENSNLFSRILLEEPIFLETGDTLFIRYDLIISYDPSEPLSVSTPISCLTSESGILQFQLPAINFINNLGETISSEQGGDCNEPSTKCEAFISDSSDNPANIFNTIDRSGSNNIIQDIYLEDYILDSFTRRKILSFNTAQANSTWRSVGLGTPEQNGVIFVFNNNFSKIDGNASFIFDFSWPDLESEYTFKTLAYWAENPEFFFKNPILEYLMNDYNY